MNGAWIKWETKVLRSSIMREEWEVRHVFMDLVILSKDLGLKGRVPRDPFYVARVLNCHEDTISRAIAVLCSPDPETPDDDFAGRRLIDDGEFLYIVKWSDYQKDPDPTAAERQARYRERMRNALHRDSDGVTRNSRESDDRDLETLRLRDSETEETESKSNDLLPADGGQPTVTPKKRPRRERPPAREQVESFELTPKLREWGRENCPLVRLDEETETWKDRLRANGYKTNAGPIQDAVACWRYSMKRQQEWTHDRRRNSGTGTKAAGGVEEPVFANPFPVPEAPDFPDRD